jgi:hypothetical protein
MARPVSRSATTAREVKVVFSRLRRPIYGLALSDDLSGSQAAVLTRLHKGDGVVAATKDGPRGALCSLRSW